MSTKNRVGAFKSSEIWERIKSFQSLLAILITLGYLLGTHLSTINSLKMAIASKAERGEVAEIDRKLTRIEVKLEEAIMTRQEMNRLREYIEKQFMEMLVRQNAAEEKRNNGGK